MEACLEEAQKGKAKILINRRRRWRRRRKNADLKLPVKCFRCRTTGLCLLGRKNKTSTTSFDFIVGQEMGHRIIKSKMSLSITKFFTHFKSPGLET